MVIFGGFVTGCGRE